MKKLLLLTVICIVTQLFAGVVPQGTSFLNQNSYLVDYKDKEWYKDNIPFLDIPDKTIQEIYYYRWFSYWVNLRYVNPTDGYVVTEFSSDVWWQSAFGAIPCSGCLQIYEGRWLKNQRFMNDYQRFWATGTGMSASHNYSFWEATAGYQRFLVNGDAEFIKSLYNPYIISYYRWQNKYNKTLGLYWQEGVWDGMELSATSYQAPNEAPGYRPTINAYLYGEATHLSKIAAMVGDKTGEEQYKNDALHLREQYHKHLWDDRASFFKHKFRDEVPGTGGYPQNKYYAKESFVDAREVYSYNSWYTHLAKDEAKYSEAWKFLFDGEKGFYAKYGPTTLERSHRLFLYDANNCCRWNGMSWPFSTSQTLTAMANVLNDYENKGMVTKERFVDMLQIYSETQYKNGKPYVAEAHHPDSKIWQYDIEYRSQHYSHSTFNDIVISGLIGIRPQADNTIVVNPQIPDEWEYFILENTPYHGHLITIMYDKTGEKFGDGAGFHIYENGKKIHSQANVGKVTVNINEPNLTHNFGVVEKENYAVNTLRTGYPKATASFSRTIHPENVNPYLELWQAVDGRIRFDLHPVSRWTTTGSPNTEDWLVTDFGLKRTINRIDVCFYADGNKVLLPKAYLLEYWDNNEWKQIEEQEKSSPHPVLDRLIVKFPSIVTEKVRITATPQSSSSFGITEFEVLYEYLGELIIQTDALPNAMLNLSYEQNINVSGGNTPLSLSISEGILPPGLSMNDVGLISGIPSAIGTYSFKITVTDSEENTNTREFSINVVNSTPYKRPIKIPGVLEFENYDKGGEGVAYHDNDPQNHGNQYRPSEGVDIYAIDGGQSGYGVGWTHTGEWMQYSINVEETGIYNATIYYTTPDPMVIAELYVDNVLCEESFYLPHTGTWGVTLGGYRTVTIPVSLTKGEHKLRYKYVLCGGSDIDKIVFTMIPSGLSKIDDNDNTISIVPNPSQHNFTLKSLDKIEKILVYNSNGSLVETIGRSDNSSTFGSDYSKGNYYALVYTESGIKVKKIIKL